jgi:signal transduction histidine kinase/FixJ family two-component response regulator
VGAIIVLGSILLAGFERYSPVHPYVAFGLLCSAIALSVFKIRLRGDSTMSMAYAVDFTAVVLAGHDLAMLVAASGVLAQCLIRVKTPQPVHRVAFSVASVVIAVHTASLVWTALGGDVRGNIIFALMMPLSATATTYFAVNTMLVAGAIALSSGVSALREWNREFFWSAPAYFLSAIVAAMTALAIVYESYSLLPVAATPLYLSYRAYRSSVRRLEEERRHAQELSGMIETAQQALARATQSEAALEAEKEQLAIISARMSVTLRTISDGVITVDRDGMIVLLNEGAQKLAVVASDDAVGRHVGVLLANLGFAPAQCDSALDNVLNRGAAVRLRNDALDTSATPRLVEVMGTPTCAADGHAVGAVWVLRDITDLTQVEHERAKSARLESLGVLAGGLAHDFNNILMGVTGNLSLAQALVAPEEEALLGRLSSATAACARARGVTNQLLTFSKGGAPVKKATSARDLITEYARFGLSGSSVAATFEVDPHLWMVEADESQIGQVVQNLVLNATQAMARGGILEISMDNVDVEAESSPAPGALAPGRYVRLAVRDSGSGIPPELLARIFDPYFTTKEKGSGLGLAISHSIVQAHGGSISVESELGIGTCFTVFLPASTSQAVALVEPARHISRAGHGRVLIMDDEDMVAEVAQEMIESLGYVVRRAANGDEAIRMFSDAEQRDEPFDLVFLDLTVPGGMGGAEAVKYLREMRPTVRVIVSSGYADDSVLGRYRDHGFDGVLPKPFTIPELRLAIEELEDGCGHSPATHKDYSDAVPVSA